MMKTIRKFAYAAPLAAFVALAAFPAQGPTSAADTPANLVSNAGFEEGAAGWHLPNTFKIADDTAHSGKACLFEKSDQASDHNIATQEIAFKPGHRYQFSGWIKSAHIAPETSGATICLEWHGGKRWLGGTYPKMTPGDHDWQLSEGTSKPIPAGATSVTVALLLPKGTTGTACYDDISVEEMP